jgi:hypothetical protein
MSLNNPNGIESSVSKNTKQRRIFLKKATAGAVIASIPGRSAWANMTGSIVASGHGSNSQQSPSTLLKSKSYFVGNRKKYKYFNFYKIFGGYPFKNNGEVKKIWEVRKKGLRFSTILNTSKSKTRGEGDINIALVVIYLNAIGHNDSGENIYYPVLQQYHDDKAFARYLYQMAKDNNKTTLANELFAIIDNHS